MKKVDIFRLLSADLFVKNIGTQEQINDLIEQSFWHKKNEPYVMRYTNNGCWRSSFKYNNFDWFFDELQDSVEQVMQHYSIDDPTYAKKLKQQGELDLQYWTNINDPGSRNVLHSHQAVQYAAVYYLRAEDTGDICFYNPGNVTENCHATAPWVSVMSYTPKNGDLVLFPGWVPHDIEVNKSSKERLSIAFNISFNVKYITDGQEDY